MAVKVLKYMFVLLCLLSVCSASAEDEWREKMKYLKYAPRYFGPNAFPMPELRGGQVGTRWEAEVRGEYHVFSGDRTKDVYARIFIPIADGRAGIEVCDVVYEYYNMAEATVEERHAAGKSWPNGAHGDVIVSTFFQVLTSDKWLDVMVEAALKSASGNRLADARFTDAASYWFDLNLGRNLYASADGTAFLRLQGYGGFYCWMTNDMIHRQNDAFVYSIGLSGAYRGLSVAADVASIYGYENEGDRPLQFRTKLEYEYKKNCLSLRYRHGMKDSLYDSFSVGYKRYF